MTYEFHMVYYPLFHLWNQKPKEIRQSRGIIFQCQTYSFHTPFPHYLYLLRSDHKSCLGLPSSKSTQCLLGSRSFWSEILKPLGQQHLEAAGAALAVSWHLPSSRADNECWRQKNNRAPGKTQGSHYPRLSTWGVVRGSKKKKTRYMG